MCSSSRGRERGRDATGGPAVTRQGRETVGGLAATRQGREMVAGPAVTRTQSAQPPIQRTKMAEPMPPKGQYSSLGIMSKMKKNAEQV